MKLTDEQKDAINHVGSAMLVACPGSGKTRAIIAKLLRCVDGVRDTPRRVACITYTNVAVHEIENRIRVYGTTGDEDYCDVSTIHSFCQNNILRYFHWKLDEYKDGYTVLPSDADRYLELAADITEEWGLDNYALQEFELLNRRPNGAPITAGNVPPEAAIEFWKRLQTEGYVDFCSIVYFSYRLLIDYPSIRQAIASRFASILVDEFQDTTALQVGILNAIAGEGRTSFFLVGDPEQSIYSFAGAERTLMFKFANSINAQEFPLSGNFRSSTPVIHCVERLIPRTPSMFAAGEAAVFEEEPTYEHAESNFAAITDAFLPVVEELGIPFGDAAILAQNWFQLMPLGQQLREYGIPVVGPGARPYKRQHVFARLAEQVCAYIETPSPEFIRHAERELFNIVLNVTGKADFRVFSYDGRRVVFRLLRGGQRLCNEHDGAIDWLHAASEFFSQVLCEEGILPNHARELLSESVQDMVTDMENRKVDTANLVLSDLGMFANPADNLKLMTMHAAKGREFSAIALIALHDGWVPYHNQYNPLTTDGLQESRRLLYVAMTRTKRLLMLFTDANNWRPTSRFLSEIGF